MRSLFLFLGSLILAKAASGSPLQLRLQLPDGSFAQEFRPTDQGIGMETGQGSAPLPARGRWILQGDPQSAIDEFAWGPPFAICRRWNWAVPSEETSYHALVTLIADAPGMWTTAELRDAIAVFVWIRGGRIVRVNPVPVRSFYLAPGQTVAAGRFTLSEAEARGAATVLLLRNNQFVRPRGSDPRLQAMASALFLAPDEEVTRLFAPSALESVPRGHLLRLLEMAASIGNEKAGAAILERLAPTLSAEEAARSLEISVRAARIEFARTVLRLMSGRIRAKNLADVVAEAIEQREDDLACLLARQGMARPGRLPGTDRLAGMALEFGARRTLEALVGPELSRFIAKEGGRRFPAVARRGDAAAIRLLIGNGVNPGRFDPDAVALAQAVAQKDLELLRELLAAGAKPDPANERMVSPLLYAVRTGNADAVRLLLKAGASVERRNPMSASVSYAASRGFASDTTPWPEARMEPEAPTGRTVNALEMALLLRQRSVVFALAEAGARINRTSPVYLELLEGVIAVDHPSLLDAAFRDGWKAEQALAGRCTVRMLAEAYGSERCLELIRKRPAAAGPSLPVGAMDTAPLPIEITMAEGLRRRDREHAEIKLLVEGIVDPEGLLRAVSVSGSGDADLCAAVRRGAAQFRFKPAMRDGAAVYARITLPLILPSQLKLEFQLEDLDLPPVQLAPTPNGKRDYPPLNQGLFTVLFSVTRSEFEELAQIANENGSRDVFGEIMPFVRFVVGSDGRPTDAKVLWAKDRFDLQGALESLARFRYAPGIADGYPVAVPMSQRISAR